MRINYNYARRAAAPASAQRPARDPVSADMCTCSLQHGFMDMVMVTSWFMVMVHFAHPGP